MDVNYCHNQLLNHFFNFSGVNKFWHKFCKIIKDTPRRTPHFLTTDQSSPFPRNLFDFCCIYDGICYLKETYKQKPWENCFEHCTLEFGELTAKIAQRTRKGWDFCGYILLTGKFPFHCFGLFHHIGREWFRIWMCILWFRHDLKIYASDEGRVQMTAAAFAKVYT